MSVRYLKPISFEELVTIWDKPVPLSLKERKLFIRVKPDGSMHKNGGGSYVLRENLNSEDVIFMTLTLTAEIIVNSKFSEQGQCPIYKAYKARTGNDADVCIFGLTDLTSRLIYEFNEMYITFKFYEDLKLARAVVDTEPQKIIRVIKLKGNILGSASQSKTL